MEQTIMLSDDANSYTLSDLEPSTSYSVVVKPIHGSHVGKSATATLSTGYFHFQYNFLNTRFIN